MFWGARICVDTFYYICEPLQQSFRVPHCPLRVALDCDQPSLKSLLGTPSLLPFLPPNPPTPLHPHPHSRTELPAQSRFFLLTDFSFLPSLMAPPSFSKVSTMEAPDWRPLFYVIYALQLSVWLYPACGFESLWRLTTPTWHLRLWNLLWDTMQICCLDFSTWIS